MRGVETRIQEIRRMIFREVARMAYDTENSVAAKIEELPYEIIPGEVGNFRNDVFLERAIVGERLRLAMGLPCRSIGSVIRQPTACRKTVGFLWYRGKIIGYGDPELIVWFIPYSHRIYEQIYYGLAELFVIDISFTEFL